jgi:hypothetical protein
MGERRIAKKEVEEAVRITSKAGSGSRRVRTE